MRGARPKTSAGPREDFGGDTAETQQCKKATGFLAISHKDGAATKRQGNKGSEVPMIWSKIEVDPPSMGKLFNDAQTLGDHLHNGLSALGGLTGLSKGVLELDAEKMNRVCGKLMQKDDAFVRSGIAKFRFILYKHVTK